MVNKLLFQNEKVFPNNSSILNTRWGNQLLQLLQKGPVPVVDLQRDFPGPKRELMTTIQEFLQAGFSRYKNGKLELALPFITREEQVQYRKRMLDSHLVLVNWIEEFLASSFYQKRLLQLARMMDYDLVDLSFLLVSCFGMAWGGRTLFDALKPWEGDEMFILPDGEELGLCQSMTSYTSRYTFSSFGYAEDVFRNTLGNLLSPGSFVSSFEPLVGKRVHEKMTPVMGLAATHILDGCGDLLLALKGKHGIPEDEETRILLDLLEALDYIAGGRIQIPLFTQEHKALLVEITRGFQQLLCDWYLQEACACFRLGTDKKAFNPGVSWLLQMGQLNELLLERNHIFFPRTQRYRSLLFACPVEEAREISQQYSWLDFQQAGGEQG